MARFQVAWIVVLLVFFTEDLSSLEIPDDSEEDSQLLWKLMRVTQTDEVQDPGAVGFSKESQESYGTVQDSESPDSLDDFRDMNQRQKKVFIALRGKKIPLDGFLAMRGKKESRRVNSFVGMRGK